MYNPTPDNNESLSPKLNSDQTESLNTPVDFRKNYLVLKGKFLITQIFQE